MREILFRAKTVDNIWHYGFPIVYSDGSFDFYELEDNPIVETYNEIYKETKKGTLGQYTGIEDKNGTKIFEGDFIKAKHNTNLYSVYWNEDRFYIEDVWGNLIKPTQTAINHFECEIVGNIYDNPELIENNK